MKITEDVRKYAAEQGIAEEEAIAKGMAEKSEEFVEKGAKDLREWERTRLACWLRRLRRNRLSTERLCRYPVTTMSTRELIKNEIAALPEALQRKVHEFAVSEEQRTERWLQWCRPKRIGSRARLGLAGRGRCVARHVAGEVVIPFPQTDLAVGKR